MYYKNYPLEDRNTYKELLNILWSLSNLFSESKVPYLYYRSAENVYCKAFNAENLARSDVSVDAVKGTMWIWLKTFLEWNNKTFQKVAEFNASRPQYASLNNKDKILEISKLRNERISFTKRVYNLKELMYHCVVRSEWKFSIYEDSFDSIDILKLRIVKASQRSIHFTDWKNEYSFNISKSTLNKKFYTDAFEDSLNINIINDPFELLEKLPLEISKTKQNTYEDFIILPLYWPSWRSFERSWLNQWNANWRKRDINEAYIPVPSWIHSVKKWFFPNKDQDFTLILPNWSSIKTKICQSQSKALMSNPNKDLWKWLLREVLNLKEWELVTRRLLDRIWIDSVIVYKISSLIYQIDFKATWSYELFKAEHN